MTTYTISQPYQIGLNIATGDTLIVTLFGSVNPSAARPALAAAGADTIQIDGFLNQQLAGQDTILLNGANSLITVGATGRISGDRCVNVQGNQTGIIVSGRVEGFTAVNFNGAGNTLSVMATGFVQGRDAGLKAEGGTNLVVNNAGHIGSTNGTAIQSQAAGNAIANVGTIDGAVFILASSGLTTIANTGLIDSASAIVSASDTNVTNTGTIRGKGGIACSAPNALNLFNSGYVLGIGYEAIIQSGNTGSATIINNGFLQGGSGTAVTLGGAADFFDGRNGLQFGSVNGGAGNDALFGGAGNDFLYGGDDNDQLSGGAAGDYLDGGAGFDYARYDFGGAVTADLAMSSINTGDAAGDTYVSIEGLIGSNSGDTLYGDASANTLFGLGGADGIAGGDGNDLLYGGDGGDVLAGGNGNDLIYGQAGGDVLYGGAGTDSFLYTSVADGGDLIADFNAGGTRDSFDLRPLFDGTGYAGNDPRGAGLMSVVQNGADTDVYVYGAFLFRIPNLYAPALNDTYFTFQ